MREPDRGDVDLVLRLYELRREPEMRRAREFLLTFQPATWEELHTVMQFTHPENAHFRQVLSYWEMVADFAVRGLLHPEMFAAHCGEGLICYAKLEPFAARVREEANPRFLANLEAASTSHPAVTQRMKMIRNLVARWAAERR